MLPEPVDGTAINRSVSFSDFRAKPQIGIVQTHNRFCQGSGPDFVDRQAASDEEEVRARHEVGKRLIVDDFLQQVRTALRKRGMKEQKHAFSTASRHVTSFGAELVAWKAKQQDHSAMLGSKQRRTSQFSNQNTTSNQGASLHLQIAREEREFEVGNVLELAVPLVVRIHKVLNLSQRKLAAQ